jgi:hypothetical protein
VQQRAQGKPLGRVLHVECPNEGLQPRAQQAALLMMVRLRERNAACACSMVPQGAHRCTMRGARRIVERGLPGAQSETSVHD